MTEEMAEKIKALAKRLEALEKEFEATKEYIQTHDHGTPAMPYVPVRVSDDPWSEPGHAPPLAFLTFGGRHR